jgi:hypothetical protein
VDQILPARRSDKSSVRLPFRVGYSSTMGTSSRGPKANRKETLYRAMRAFAPALVALSFVTAAHAQGTMDFSGAQTLMGTFKTTTLAVVREGAERNGYEVEGFAPTSRAAQQLRDAGIRADTLQGFLARGNRQPPDGTNRHLYLVDESSLSSTKQMREFFEKIGPQDKVLLIGDTRQHQGVDAGKPFEQLQDAGMRTALLGQIVRQKDPELLKAVEHLSRSEIKIGVEMLQQQGRVTEIADPQQRIEAIAKSYAARPENTIIVSPDNASRRQINQAVRRELQALGALDMKNRSMRVLAPRSDMTGADRAWAARYQAGDVLHYTRGSKKLGIGGGSRAQVVTTNLKDNLLTVQKQNGEQVTYDPSRLRGISAYREIEREFAVGDRIQFTAPNRELHVANRDLGTLQQIDSGGRMTVRMDNDKEKTVAFDPKGDAPLRPRIRRDLAQLTRTYRRACLDQYGYRGSPGTHQQPLCLCVRLAGLARRADLYQQCGPHSRRISATMSASPPRLIFRNLSDGPYPRWLWGRPSRAVCVCIEKGIDLPDGMPTVASFPWKYPSLVAGGVRHSDGSWGLREPEP